MSRQFLVVTTRRGNLAAIWQAEDKESANQVAQLKTTPTMTQYPAQGDSGGLYSLSTSLAERQMEENKTQCVPRHTPRTLCAHPHL